tara:strand:- start:15808 stop:16371 length:564 start_codon:yes stop_codon:yes gene_type:complete
VPKKHSIKVKTEPKKKTLEEWMEMGLDEDEAKIMMKAKDKVEKKKATAEEIAEKKKSLEKEKGIDKLRMTVKMNLARIAKFEEENSELYKKGHGIRHAEGTEGYERCQKRYKEANSEELTKKNRYCPNSNGVDGTDGNVKDEKTGEMRPRDGCKYCCRSEKTMSEHLKKCKWTTREEEGKKIFEKEK